MSEDSNKKYNESYAQTRGLNRVPGTNQPVGWAKDRHATESRQNAAKGGGGCFVATAAYGDFDAPEVVFLRVFRDEKLNRNVPGRAFVKAYYAVSPTAARFISRSGILRKVVRKLLLQPIISVLRIFDRNTGA